MPSPGESLAIEFVAARESDMQLLERELVADRGRKHNAVLPNMNGSSKK